MHRCWTLVSDAVGKRLSCPDQLVCLCRTDSCAVTSDRWLSCSPAACEAPKKSSNDACHLPTANMHSIKLDRPCFHCVVVIGRAWLRVQICLLARIVAFVVVDRFAWRPGSFNSYLSACTAFPTQHFAHSFPTPLPQLKHLTSIWRVRDTRQKRTTN